MRLSLIREKKEKPTVVAVDLDGTLAKELPTYDPEKIGPPIYNAKSILDKVKELGAVIVVNTCRSDKIMIKSWFEEHEIPYDHINENPNQPKDTSHKIMADRYWDNRQPSWRGLQYAYEELQRYMQR
jgi:hypothetical protein